MNALGVHSYAESSILYLCPKDKNASTVYRKSEPQESFENRHKYFHFLFLPLTV
jgi:hypothetical protein